MTMDGRGRANAFTSSMAPSPLRALGRRRLQQLIGEGLDPLAQALDAARRERLMHECTQPGVVRRIQVEHVALQRLEEARNPRSVRGGGGALAPGRFTNRSSLRSSVTSSFVPGHQPGGSPTQHRSAPDRRICPKARIERIGVRLEAGARKVRRGS